MYNELNLETVLFLCRHIEHPCVDSTTGLNIRYFYIAEAERMLLQYSESESTVYLRECINQYKL